MAYLLGMPDNVLAYASTSALSAVDVSLTVAGYHILEGQLASVTDGYLYQYQSEPTLAINGTTVLTALNGGAWVEYFLATEKTYILINDADNSISGAVFTGIVNANISASAAIAFSKLAALPSAQILVGSAGNVPTAVALTGDIAVTNTGVSSIASGVIVNADVNASAAIDFSKLATLTSTNILVGSAGNVATSVAVTGDVTIGNTGVTAIGSGKVLKAMLATGINPAAICVAAGTGSYAGGSTTATFTIAGMLDTDILVVSKVTNANASYIITVTHSTTTASIVLDTDPGASTFAYQLMRAAT